MNKPKRILNAVALGVCCFISLLIKRAKIVMVGLLLVAAPAAAGVVGGFGGPLFGLATAPNGDLLVADAGIGIISIRHGKVDKPIELPGVTDVSPIGSGSMWVATGAMGAPPEGPQNDTGQGLYRVSRGEQKKVANLFEFEALYNPHNPDGQSPPDSNPFDVQSLGPNAALVVDAGGNDLLQVNKHGEVNVLAVFPNELVSTANLKQLAECPSPAPFCGLPDFIPAQAVSTSIAVDRHGYIYVGELKGFPAPTGESNIWRVSPHANWAQCGASDDCVKVFDGGFTSIIDLAFGPGGQLYVAELDEASWAAVEIFGTPTGGAIKACNVESGICHKVASGIPELTAITFGKDGSLWATRNSLTPGDAEVFTVFEDDDDDDDDD